MYRMINQGETFAGRRLGLVWLWALLQLLASATFLIWLCFRPGLFDWYYPVLVSRDHAGDAGLIVRWLDSREPGVWLNSHLKKGALRPKEIAHFEDVRRVLRRGRILMACSWVALGVLGLVAQMKSKEIRAAQERVFILTGAILGLGLFFALWDWRVLFAWLHQPFFGPTSWRMPRAAYSLALYPERFWQVMSFAVIAGTILIGAVVLWGSALRRKAPAAAVT